MTNCQLLFFLHKLHMYILTPHYRTSLLVIRQAILQKAATLISGRRLKLVYSKSDKQVDTIAWNVNVQLLHR